MKPTLTVSLQDADIAGEGEVFWGAIDGTPPDIAPKDLASLGLDIRSAHTDSEPAWFKFGPGSGQIWKGAPISASEAASTAMTKKSERGVYPLVIRLRGVVQGEGEQSQTSFVALRCENSNQPPQPVVLEQKVVCRGIAIEIEGDVYGADVRAHPHSNTYYLLLWLCHL